MVICRLPLEELPSKVFEIKGAVGHFVELFGVGPVGPFHPTIELRRAGWQHEKLDASTLAYLLECSMELGASIHLFRTYLKWHPQFNSVDKPSGRGRCGPAVYVEDVPLARYIMGGEVLDRHTRQWPQIRREIGINQNEVVVTPEIQPESL